MKSSPNPPANKPLIRASELAQYGFCQRAWWLGVVKKRPHKRQGAQIRGLAHHRQHARHLRQAARWRRAGYLLLIGGSALLIAWLRFWLF